MAAAPHYSPELAATAAASAQEPRTYSVPAQLRYATAFVPQHYGAPVVVSNLRIVSARWQHSASSTQLALQTSIARSTPLNKELLTSCTGCGLVPMSTGYQMVVPTRHEVIPQAQHRHVKPIDASTSTAQKANFTRRPSHNTTMHPTSPAQVAQLSITSIASLPSGHRLPALTSFPQLLGAPHASEYPSVGIGHGVAGGPNEHGTESYQLHTEDRLALLGQQEETEAILSRQSVKPLMAHSPPPGRVDQHGVVPTTSSSSRGTSFEEVAKTEIDTIIEHLRVTTQTRKYKTWLIPKESISKHMRRPPQAQGGVQDQADAIQTTSPISKASDSHVPPEAPCTVINQILFANLNRGDFVRISTNRDIVLSAARLCHIEPSAADEARLAAAGSRARVLEKDDNDWTVRCCIMPDGVVSSDAGGDIVPGLWLGVGALSHDCSLATQLPIQVLLFGLLHDSSVQIGWRVQDEGLPRPYIGGRACIVTMRVPLMPVEQSLPDVFLEVELAYRRKWDDEGNRYIGLVEVVLQQGSALQHVFSRTFLKEEHRPFAKRDLCELIPQSFNLRLQCGGALLQSLGVAEPTLTVLLPHADLMFERFLHAIVTAAWEDRGHAIVDCLNREVN